MKLLKLHEKKFYVNDTYNSININRDKDNINSNIIENELPKIKRLKNNNLKKGSIIDTLSETDIRNTTINKFQSSKKALGSIAFGNVYIVYKNNKSNSITF